jgi:hypothetical protein
MTSAQPSGTVVSGSTRGSRPSGQDAVRQLATSVRLLQGRRDLRDLFNQKLTQLQRGGLVTVKGEEAMLAAVDSLLQSATRLLDTLPDDTTATSDALGELSATLEGYEWDVLDDLMPQLSRKVDEQDKLILGLQAAIDEWTSRLEPVRKGIDAALDVKAPVARERATIERMTGLVTAARRALADGRYPDVHDPIQRLVASEEPPETLDERVREKVEATRRFTGRAEVLLLHSVTDYLHSYIVLLRTPSEAGSQGFNIQDSSSLVEQDRHYIREAIAQITRAVDLRIARAFRQSGEMQGEASPRTAGTVRDLRPEPPAPGTTPSEDLPKLVSEVGEVMFRLIAPDRMRNYLSSNPCSLTITTDDLELPWELMYDDSLEESASEAGLGFLCLQRPIARMPMGRAFPRLRPVTQQRDKLRFLLVYADPDGNLGAAGQEVDKIKAALEGGPGSSDENIEVTTLKREEVTGEKLNRALLTGRYDVIHFAGHAYFSEEDPDLSGLVLHGHERFLSQKIERFVEGQPLVFLNACQTGRSANASAPQSVGEYFWKPAQGLASAFLYGGALGCVGSLWPVYDDPAAEFAIEFYRQVLEGQMLGEAMRLARRAAREKYPDSITWASFVLYGDPTYRLVR